MCEFKVDVFLWALVLWALIAWHSVTHHSVFLDPSSKIGSHPHFLVKWCLFLYTLTCAIARLHPHPSLPLFCNSQHKLYSIQMCFDGRRFSWVVLVIFQQLVLVQVLWVRAFNRSSIAFVTACFLYTACWKSYKDLLKVLKDPTWYPECFPRTFVCLITVAAGQTFLNFFIRF